MLALWYLSIYCTHKLHQVLHCTNRPLCLRHLTSKIQKVFWFFFLPPLLLIWEQQCNPLFVFASSLLWIGSNVLLLISRLKISEVLLLSESAVDLFSTGFHHRRLFSLFCRLTQQAHLSVFWGLSLGVGVGRDESSSVPPPCPPLLSPSLLLHG